MMEATPTNALAGFSYPLRTRVQAAITRGWWLSSSVLERDSLHTTVDHPDKLLGAGVQVADPTHSKEARIHVYKHRNH